MSRFAVDVGLLRRRRELRIALAARTVSFLGSEFTIVAIPFQVFALTGSPFAVGWSG